MDKIILYKEGIDMKAIIKPYTEDLKTKETLPDILYYIDQVYDNTVVLVGITKGGKKTYHVNKNRILKTVKD